MQFILSWQRSEHTFIQLPVVAGTSSVGSELVLAVQPSSPAKVRTITSGTTTLGDTETYMHFHCSSSTTIPPFTGAHMPNWDLALPYPGSLKCSSTGQ